MGGLRQRDPLSPMPFALAADTLSAMFWHALKMKVLLSVPLEPLDSICHLQYADDLIIFSTESQEDLHIIKLILYLFEGASGFTINFSKSCLYSTNYGYQPNEASAAILNCKRDWLPLTYLGVSLLGRRPRRQDWTKLTLMVRPKLTSLKANYLLLGGRLTLVNSVLTSILTYWMSMFNLPSWVIKEIDMIRRDFLWKGPKLGVKGFRLVA